MGYRRFAALTHLFTGDRFALLAVNRGPHAAVPRPRRSVAATS